MKKVVFIYGNLPAYRKDFFTNLSKKLKENDIEMKVFYGYVTNKVTKQDDSNNYNTMKFETKKKNLKLLTFSKMVGLLEQIKKDRESIVAESKSNKKISQ